MRKNDEFIDVLEKSDSESRNTMDRDNKTKRIFIEKETIIRTNNNRAEMGTA